MKIGRLNGYHVLFMLLGFFGVMIIVNVIFTVYAVRSFPGEQVEQSYIQGLNYNQALEDRARQEELGWSTQVGLERTESGSPMLITYWLDEFENGITQLEVSATLTRPATREGQRIVDLSANGPGRYEIILTDLETGDWNAEITAQSPDGETVTAHKSLTWTR